MIMNRNNINAVIPELKLKNRQGNLYIDNMEYEATKQLLEKFLTAFPSELITSKYKEKAYAEKEVYLINSRYYELKKSKNGGFYLFEL